MAWGANGGQQVRVHPANCICLACECCAAAGAWANRSTGRAPTAQELAGVLLTSMSPNAALQTLLRSVRYVKLCAQEAEANVDTHQKPVLRLVK